ncbi:hypothetical protein GH714_021282 [Hevea brasiliensis]|uniref:Uncharacterized protein n=1 Tax=Hevea brasiliensis TaxID=3981 RepID=A0A6A6KEU3_HEVBR|nr:hypothetical protein GH714_021282 [Hevea brasiliensis]
MTGGEEEVDKLSNDSFDSDYYVVEDTSDNDEPDNGANVESMVKNINEEDIGQFNERPIKDDDLHSIMGLDGKKE